MGPFRIPDFFKRKPYTRPSNMPKAAFYRPVHGPEVDIKSHKEVRVSVCENQNSVPSVITTYLSKVQVIQPLEGGARVEDQPLEGGARLDDQPLEGGVRVEDQKNKRKSSISSRNICLCGKSSCTGSHIYWMSCNQCGLKFSPLNGKHMILVKCGCIFCQHCASSRNKEYCQICLKSTSQREALINPNLPDKAKEMFSNINYPLKMMATRNSFRNKHFNRYLEYLTDLERNMEKKLQEMEKEASDVSMMMRNLEHQIRKKEKDVARWERICARQQYN